MALLDKPPFPVSSFFSNIMDNALAGGRGLRGSLVQSMARACGGRAPRLIDAAAAALEHIHSASLIVDDLPSQDAATRRRGRPALHLMHGMATAELTAHALVAMGLSRILDVGTRRSAQVAYVLTQSIVSLCSAQCDGLRGTGRRGDASAPLFAAAARMGALSAGARSDTVESLGQASWCWGVAYQWWDDACDGEVSIPEARRHITKHLRRADGHLASATLRHPSSATAWRDHFARLLATVTPSQGINEQVDVNRPHGG